MFAEITFCPTINLEQPVMVSILFPTCQLRYGRNLGKVSSRSSAGALIGDTVN